MSDETGAGRKVATMGDLYPIRYRSPRGSVLTVHAGRLHEAVADWDYTRIYPAGTINYYPPEDVTMMPVDAAATCSKCRMIAERRVTRSQHYAWWLRAHGSADGWTYPPPPAQPSPSRSEPS